MGIANAQVNDQQPPPTRTQAQGGQGGATTTFERTDRFQGVPSPDGGMQRQMMMGGGPATMVTDNQFLYVLQGNTLYKINKANLEVIGQGQLPMPMPMGRGGFEGGPGGPGGAPGVRGGNRGGGGQNIPPPDGE
jgi:hypothetical protein